MSNYFLDISDAALVLKEIGYPRIKPFLNDIMVWLQDLNWPGTEIIIELLLTVEKSILIEIIETALKEAIKSNDKMWIDCIRVLVKRKKSLPKIFRIMNYLS